MKILNPLRFIKGASSGGGSSSVPALIPPKGARNELKRSVSVMQLVDILCEGPIYGLVDQFGKKVYGLDMLKGVYLNGTPVMNNKGEYNFRNILMEINLGTENQKPLPNFKEVHVFKPSNFKLLGPIKGGEDDIRPNKKFYSDPGKVETRNFTQWARERGDWPSENKDPFIFVHKIRNKDVSKLKISLLVEALFDTVDQGDPNGNKPEDMGMSASSEIELLLKWGLENSNVYTVIPVTINGTATSPFAYMLGEGEAALATTNSANGALLKRSSGASFSSGGGNPPSNALPGGYYDTDGEWIPNPNISQA